jgi:NADPH:quinone reductase-like Zn-dependent oxidoreductase
MSSATATTVRCAVAADGRVDVASRPRPMLAPDMVLVRPTTALLTPLEREVVRGLGTAAGGARVLGTSCVGVVEDASRAMSPPGRSCDALRHAHDSRRR